jgi:hypothetical protein
MNELRVRSVQNWQTRPSSAFAQPGADKQQRRSDSADQRNVEDGLHLVVSVPLTAPANERHDPTVCSVLAPEEQSSAVVANASWKKPIFQNCG